LTQREVERRRKQVQDIRNNFNELTEKVSKNLQNSSTTSANNANRFKGSQPDKKFIEAFDVENMSSQQLLQSEKDLLNSQDRHVDDLMITVGGIKQGQENINKELKYQNEDILLRLDGGLDKNLKQAKRADGKLVDLLKKADNCKLYLIIASEILFLVFLLMVF